MADETSIKVSAATRDRLAALATEQGTTIRQLVEELAEGRPTQAEYAERAEQARAELASVLGTVPSEEAEAKARDLLERLGARRDSAAA
ncbi:hypothetical protein GCM10010215_75560 [Streptomyces virginiae]|uniref:Ribbon-helix-helix protein CopG domain-containing protein n=1 Tax=Streptomyces virginiae TaxID=1961 RepID=A0ABQ3NNX3_STRVG|nr:MULTISPECIES: hypothetical protein [Streptomyces]GLV93013.1 hypothetical protein Slala04_44670 [Streptomyces lavendulae subsp. lavendulae]KOU10423.1 hypothetical protein ADK49_32655 [Streptomyces sp. WM6349]KOV54570.1 hypothetical protein ADK98_03545 [Streptomyces sp. H036]MBP2341646.1 putative DNA-binding protein [Streptomyces virginiae]MCI4079352.1 hypothetical protein [Streptomyces sp. MMS21 TC-5]